MQNALVVELEPALVKYAIGMVVNEGTFNCKQFKEFNNREARSKDVEVKDGVDWGQLGVHPLYSDSAALNASMIVTSAALIIWKGLMCVTGSESPVVVVLSGSMEPGFKRQMSFIKDGDMQVFIPFGCARA
ncbi:hypothetical protein HPP92_019881 [Vanilla planifolia]|uniref:Signal peptidase complex catalytic subunit SEC11 n=1 Tax=Vanilla planifolia TaxID=51239 RepID=A0A835QDB7_VANPL|nr:hypothetical protein HPP92_019881 [Vanilla planifolia]